MSGCNCQFLPTRIDVRPSVAVLGALEQPTIEKAIKVNALKDR
jgi:hypothetical protein